MDLGARLDSCSRYDIGNFLQTCKSRVKSQTLPHYAMHVSILDHFQHFNFDLSRSLKVKCDGIGLSIYAFLLMFNSNIINIWPNSAPLREIRFQNLSDWRSNVMMSLNSPYMVSSIYSNHMSNSHRLALIATQIPPPHGIVVRASVRGAGGRGLIPDRITPKT